MTNTTNTMTQKVTVYINLDLTGYTIFYLLSLAVKIYGEGFTEEVPLKLENKRENIYIHIYIYILYI